MKLKLIFSATLVAGILSARAVTQPADPAVNTPAELSAATNSNPEDAMKALFGDPVIVKAKGFDIKQSELDEVMSGAKASAAARGQKLPPAVTAAILNQLITIHSLLQEATPADRAVGAAEAEEQYTNLVARFGSKEAFDRQLKAVGMTVEELRKKANDEATAKATLKRVLGVQATDAEAKAFFDKHQADFEQPETAEVRHILLMTIDPSTHDPLPTNAVAAKRKQMDDILKQIRDGADFATLAEKYSEDPGSKNNGGELPPFTRGQMVPEFETTAFGLTNNQVSDVITTQYGYHIIKMIKKSPAKQFAYDDKLPNSDQTVADVCKDQVVAEKIKQLAPDYMNKLRTKLDVQIVDPSLKALDDSLRAQAEQAAADDQGDTNAPAMPAK
jgi:parvulin-like peptidyl-prolyl isomerase